MLRDLPSLSFRQVRRTPQEPLFNALLHKHHELGYRQPVGEHLKYLVYAGQWLVAALAWSSAAHGLTCRDRLIGWSPEARRRNRHLLAYNTRFLVPPWVQVPHLASHVLGRMARRLSADWQQLYGHPVYFLETFVDPRGTGALATGRRTGSYWAKRSGVVIAAPRRGPIGRRSWSWATHW